MSANRSRPSVAATAPETVGDGLWHQSTGDPVTLEVAVDAARDRARAEGRPIRWAEVDELLRLVDDGGELPPAEAVGND